MSGVVIVGAGLAGLRGAEHLRQRGYDGDVTIVGDETHLPYNRPPLSKELLRGDVTAEELYFDTSSLEANWQLGRTATSLNVQKRIVHLDDGEALSYDRLLIATGCGPRPWPKATPLAGVHQLRTIEDARALRQEALHARRAIIIGAGFIGCEIASTLRSLGVEVTLVDVASEPMAALGTELGTRARRWHEDAGVQLLMGAQIDGFLGSDVVEGVRLADGHVVEGDLVVVGIGAIPNTEWLIGSGLDLTNGAVVCDRRCLALGAPEIGVAGDVAAWPHPHTGTPGRVEHWTNAVETAMTAAANLDPSTAGELFHEPVPTFWSDQYDKKLRGAGSVSSAYKATVVVDEPATGKLVVEFHDQNTLRGAVTINGPREHLAYRRSLSPNADIRLSQLQRVNTRPFETHKEIA